MKTIALLFAAAMLVVHADKHVYNSLKEQDLKGNVQCVVNTTYELSAGKENYQRKNAMWYDKAGNEVVDTSYDKDGIFSIVSYTNKYDANGRRIEEQQLDGIEKKPDWRIVYTYDKDGRMMGTNRYKADGFLMQRVIYRYDADGNNTEQYSYGSTGMPNAIQTNRYNKSGVLQEANDYSLDPSYGSKHHSEYSPKGSLVALDNYSFGDSSSVYTHKSLFSKTTYDAKGNWIQTTAIKDYGRFIDTTIQKRTVTYY